jgi:hypothetical protein
VDVTGVDVGLSAALRGKLVRRVLLALSRFGPRVRKVTVRLAEPVNALGGVDHRCQMRAWMREDEDVHAEAINGGFETAVTRAAAQLARRMDFGLSGGPTGEADGPAGAPRPASPPHRPKRST